MIKTVKIFCPGINKEVEMDIYNNPTKEDAPYGPTHGSLSKIYYDILQPMGVKCKTEYVPTRGSSSVYKTTLVSEEKNVEEFGESNSENLKDPISKSYPEKMAQKRSFDHAVLTYLGLYGVYAKEESVPEKDNDYRLKQYLTEADLFGTEDDGETNNYEEFGFTNIDDKPSSDTSEVEGKDTEPVEDIKISEFKDFDDKERFKQLMKETVPSGKTFGQLYILKGKKRISPENLKKEFDGTDDLYSSFMEFNKLAACIYAETDADDRKEFWDLFKQGGKDNLCMHTK